TGGAMGIGGDMVRQFAGQGARVGFIDIDEPAGVENVKRCVEAGCAHEPLFVTGDVRDIDRLRTAIHGTAEHFGPIQVLINNAASDDRHVVEDVTPEYWDERFQVNLRHQFFAIQAVVPYMREIGGGSIINLGSSSWMIKEDFFPAYATAKSAVQGLTRTMARYLGADNIRVNAVVPGWVVTERQLEKWWSQEGEDETMKLQCLKKRIYPEEFNQMVLFLAADDGGACTAQSYIVDAGRAGL
ncbi:MAG: SDR family NAD(P)-dependent oxidoreductase, partial [Alphaproteobacteria bacterium]